MAAVGSDLESVELTEREHWLDGPPHALFKQMRAGCPIHWTERFEEFPEEAGFWSVTTADDIHTVSRDWQTYSSAHGITAAGVFPQELIGAMFIGMDPPKHDRLKALFQAGFTPKRIAAHEDAIRAIVVRVLDRLDEREDCDLVNEVAQPVVARVIGSFMGIAEEEDEIWARLMNSTLGAGDLDVNPDGVEGALEKDIPEIFERCRRLIAERREHPTDDLTSVLVHAVLDGEKLEEHEIVMGFFLLMAAGNDSTKATFCSAMRALMEDPAQMQALLDEPSLIPSAVEEALRMFPAFAHFRRTATCDTELHGQKIRAGEKVVLWYASSNRDEAPLLSRHGARAPGAEGDARGDAQALPGHAARRHLHVRRIPLHQSAQAAPRPARGVVPRAGRPSTPQLQTERLLLRRRQTDAHARR